MVLLRFLARAIFCAVALEQFCSVLAFPLYAVALKDVSIYSDIGDRGLEGRQGEPVLRQERLAFILKDEAVQRLHDLGQVSDSKEFLQRTFMSPAGVRAGQLIQSWMAEAGLFTWIDDIGNVRGRFDGVLNPYAPALLLGSHMDTVIDAGKYDGPLGIITAIAAVKALHESGRLVNFPRPIEVIAFSDEEGIRFQSTFLGSGFIAGTLSTSLLQSTDRSGVTLQEALQRSSLPGTPASLSALEYDAGSVWGYVEVHIEQGPVLESEGVPLGVVDAIAGQNRLRVSMKGVAGHAGTVPMVMRRDPMTAAALAIVAIDELCMHPEDILIQGTTFTNKPHGENSIVCTVGEIVSWPGASNVIPGEVVFSVDVRANSDMLREAAVSTMKKTINDICKNRAIECNIEHKHEAKTVACDSGLIEKLRAASSFATYDLSVSRNISDKAWKQEKARFVPTISSGAGHDALAMAQFTKVGMMFVRCAGGISHSPDEHVREDDIWIASSALLSFLESELLASVLV